MAWVMCRHDWPGVFRRSVRDGRKIVRVLEFSPGKPIELDTANLPAITKDIGNALQYVALDAKGRARVVETAAEAISLVPLEPAEETGPDAGLELTPLEELPDVELLRMVEEEKLEVAEGADRAAIIEALRAAGIDGIEVGPEVDLEQLSIDQLKKYAADHQVDVSKCRRKADYIEALTAPAQN